MKTIGYIFIGLVGLGTIYVAYHDVGFTGLFVIACLVGALFLIVEVTARRQF